MEGEVASHVRMQHGVVFMRVFICGIDSLHAHVESHDEIVEIESDPQSVCHGNLFIELIEFELPSRLVFIFPLRTIPIWLYSKMSMQTSGMNSQLSSHYQHFHHI